MFRNKKSEILWGLNHKAYMYGSKIVKRPRWFCAIL